MPILSVRVPVAPGSVPDEPPPSGSAGLLDGLGWAVALVEGLDSEVGEGAVVVGSAVGVVVLVDDGSWLVELGSAEDVELVAEVVLVVLVVLAVVLLAVLLVADDELVEELLVVPRLEVNAALPDAAHADRASPVAEARTPPIAARRVRPD